jgi:electron transport complex protein RnfD
MWSVVASLVPATLAGFYLFGLSAVMVVLASILGVATVERLCGKRGSLVDGSGVLTGLLLGLTLPPGFPMWMAFLGGAFGIGFGKLIFGGLGNNVFNPALLGRAFLQAAFPVAITTWPAGGGSFFALRGDTFALPLMSPRVNLGAGQGGVDVVTEATPLGLMKFEGQATELMDLFLGRTAGCVGETSAVLLILGGLYLAWKGYLNWRIPVAVLGTVAALGTLLWALDYGAYPAGPLFLLGSGGLMLGAIFMATDMVTSPVTHRGALWFGFGVGLLVVLIRVWGGLSEGVMYAILLMNMLVPYINRKTQPRVFGTRLTPSEAKSR